MSEQEYLKPCPFCGSTANEIYAAAWEGAYCSNKKCFLFAMEHPTKEQWNKRAHEVIA